MLYAWFRKYRNSKYEITKSITASFILIELISIAMGFIFYGLLEVKVHIIWTSFVILPAVACTFILFLGNFISNDYFFYE
jgi:hypothetical protein